MGVEEMSPDELRGLTPSIDEYMERELVISENPVGHAATYYFNCKVKYNIRDLVDTEHSLLEYAASSPERENLVYPTEDEIMERSLEIFGAFGFVIDGLNDGLYSKDIEQLRFGIFPFNDNGKIGYDLLSGIKVSYFTLSRKERLDKVVVLLKDTSKSLCDFFSETQKKLTFSKFEDIRLYGESKIEQRKVDSLEDEIRCLIQDYVSKWEELTTDLRIL